MPPGSQMLSSRAAMLTPSPTISSPSISTSPRLTPMRYHALVIWRLGIAVHHQLLDRDGAFDGCDHRWKFQQQPVAHRLDYAPVEAGHDRPRRLAMLAHRPRRAGLVLRHQPGIADDVNGHDRGKFSRFSHWAPKCDPS